MGQDESALFTPQNGGLGAFGAVTTGGPQVHGVDHVSSGQNYNDDTGAKTCIAGK